MFLEYALLLAVAAGAAAIMFPYASRAVYARIKHAELQVNSPDVIAENSVVFTFVFEVLIESVGPCTRNPGAAICITFTTNDEADATIEILDSRGNVVRHLGSIHLPPGSGTRQTIQWDRRNDRGVPVFNGQYRVRIYAESSNMRGEDQAGSSFLVF